MSHKEKKISKAPKARTPALSKAARGLAKATTPRQRALMIAQLSVAWNAHPEWGIGRLLSSAASIARGELRLNPAHVTDKEIISGLKALIPDEWEEQPR